MSMHKFEYTYKDVILMGMGFLGFGVGCFLFNYYENILIFLTLGILLIFLGYIKFKFNDDIAFIFGMILTPIGLIGSAYFGVTYAKEKNEQAPIKIQCGVIENVKNHPSSKAKNSFEIVNKQERLLFPLYPRDVEVVVNGVSKNFCVRYSWDKRWSRDPKVYEINSQSFE